MTEKFMTTTKLCWKKCRKLVYTLVVLAIILGAGSAWMHYITHVSGYITAINGNQITVSNKLFDRNVDISAATLNGKVAKVGERISIEKNLSGQVLSARVGDQKMGNRGNDKMQAAKNSNGNNKRMNKGMSQDCPGMQNDPAARPGQGKQPVANQPNQQPAKTN